MHERWHMIEHLFEAALELEPEQRGAFLLEECNGDASLKSEIESLVAAHQQAQGFFAAPACEEAAQLIAESEDKTIVEQRVGRYKLIREIGRGGMGAVYLAERADDEYRQQVAVKLVKRGFDTDDILRRFRNERQILASLSHPNIARLLDGGTTDDGLPYFVMEYVAGMPITRYCDEHKLATRERLKLFRSVCAAIHYAHQNLVIHRDIKPGNILVTDEGVAKLLDFGIAKLLDPDTSSPKSETMTGLHVMTPEYASPEQCKGEQVTTATDTYSLGVVLYELLTGHRPYRLRSRRPEEIVRVICAEEPERPSTAISRIEKVAGTSDTPESVITPESVSRARNEPPDKLRRLLGGDLDNIVLMAMRKEPERRFSSAAQFSEDIRRHMEGLPVSARKDTLAYRSAKFIKRHRVGVAAVGLIVLTLVGGIVATVRQARRAERERAHAERRFQDVRHLATSFMFEFHAAIENLPGSTPARELLVKRALEYLDSLAQEAGDDASLQRELAIAYEKVGDVQGNPNLANLGDTNGALESYRKALSIREASATAGAANSETRRELANSYNRIGEILAVTGDMAGAVAHHEKALAVREKLAAEAPSDAAMRRELMLNYNDLGTTLEKSGARPKALERHRQALDIAEALAAANPADAQARRDLATTYKYIGDTLWWMDDMTGALEHYRRAQPILEDLSAADATNAKARREVARLYYEIGYTLDKVGDAAGALTILRRSLAIREELSNADPANAQARRSLAVGYGAVGRALAKVGQVTDSLQTLQHSLAIFEELSKADPLNAEARRDIAVCDGEFGEAHETFAANTSLPLSARREHWREARVWYQRSIDVYRDLSARGMMRGADAGEIEKFRNKISQTDTALAIHTGQRGAS